MKDNMDLNSLHAIQNFFVRKRKLYQRIDIENEIRPVNPA